MKKLIAALLKLIAVVGVLILPLAVVSRFADGPLVDFLPGGPLRTGERVHAKYGEAPLDGAIWFFRLDRPA